MGQFIWYGILALLLHANASPSPFADQHSFVRSAVETVPQHEPIPLPIRASVESIPLRSLRDEGDRRLPLRDAVEKRPISLRSANSFVPYEETNPHEIDDLRGSTKFYGAASHLNKESTNAERLQHGNANLNEMQQTSGRRLVICYMQSWAAYRAPPLAFTAGLIPKSCTHLHYAFAAIHPHTYAVIPANEDYDIIKGGYRIANGLKRRFPGLRVIISIGGDGTDRLFSEMVQSQHGRRKFVESAVSFLREHDFDGLDLHWVYPGEKDDREKELLISLLYELREKFSSEGFLLSTVLPPFRYQIDDGYDLSAISGATDYAILQAWDMTHGKRDEVPSRAVQHSALHRDPGASARDQRYDNIYLGHWVTETLTDDMDIERERRALSVRANMLSRRFAHCTEQEFMVKYITKHGMAPEKLVLGIPIFGRSYTLAPSTLPAPGAHVIGWGEEGQYTQTKGLLAYFEICMAEREGKGMSAVDEAGNSYAVFDNQWITYDTPNTVIEKMKFIKLSGLAGAAAWSVDMDDFRGLCGSPFPILNAISTTLNGDSLPSQSTLKIGSCESNTPYLSSDEESCAHFHFCSGGISYRIMCEEDRLYDPSTGFCGHRDPTKCIPGQSLRISVSDAARYLSQAYESDFEWSFENKKQNINLDQGFSAPLLEKKITPPNDKKLRQKVTRTRFRSETHARKIRKRHTWSTHYNYVEKTSTTTAPTTRRPRKNYYRSANKDNDKKVVCYMTSWAFYRRGDGKFVPEHIDTRLCTHVVYAYASLSPNDLVAKEFDPWTDLTNNLYERVTSLKDVNVLLGLGGWTDSVGDKYSRLVSSQSARTKFIEKLLVFLRKHNFNGLHLDWNYPVCWQSNCKKGAASDKRNFGIFVQELSKALHEVDMELGLAISGYKEVIDVAYDLPVLSKAADFMSVMTYDYHGGWERRTAHHTPLIPPPNDPLAHYSIEYAIKSLISGGADPKKLLLGLSFYGQSYRLADVEAGSRPGAPAAGPGEPGEFTKQPGMLAYYEICYRVKNLRWKTGRQENAGPYAYSDSQWVGYDDPKSIKEKVEWALQQGLGGVMAWAMDLDDFNNRCCTEPSPLLRAAGRALGRSVPPAPTTACERPPQPVTPAPPTTTTVAADGSLGGAAGGGHDHDHHSSTSTTWPSWNPSTTTPSTTQTWWPAASTTSMTTTRAPTTTSTTTITTTTRRPTTQRPQQVTTGLVEGSSCRAGEYSAAPGDCEGYLQCEGGQWRKHRCAPGLHWAATVHRCDWPSFAKCSEKPTNEASTATTTLAPMTSRPPQTTTRRTTTTRTTTTTTPRPTTTSTTSSPASSGPKEGAPCSSDGYHAVASDCNSYLHCDGHTWRMQRCAPGLHWSAKEKQCDWPKYAKCQGTTPRPTIATPMPTRPNRPRPTTPSIVPAGDRPKEDSECSSSDSHAPASTCDSYLLCVGGRWRKQKCPPGLHWDKRTSRCDWIEFAMCEGTKPAATKSTMRPTTYTTTTRRPTTSTTKKPIDIEESHRPAAGCITGTYHVHPKCEKFYVCVNGLLVAQSCAPGLVWRPDRTQCDFPGSTTCTDRRQFLSASMVEKPAMTMQNSDTEPACVNGEYSMDPTDCSRYRHCLFGKYEEFSCIKGLHWNQEKRICDWPNNSKCKALPAPAKPVMNPVPGVPSKPSHHAEDNTHKPGRPGTLPDANVKPDLLNSRYKLVCYYTNWSWYRPGIGSYVPEDIDPTLCTHIVYGFAVLGSDGLITAHDSWADYDNDFYKRVVAYKRYGIKVSLAIGGWNDSAGDKYSKLVNDPSARANFVTHVVQFIEQYGFDGLDLDWEYPKCWQVDCSKGPDSDKESFADLVQELSAALKPRGLLLSSAVSPNKMVIDAGYDVPILAKYLDWIAVMTYDYHGQWDKKTGHLAPLYYHPDDDNTYFNANYTIHYWMKKGAPASKLVMGMPLYGQTFTTGTKWDTAPELAARMNATGLNIPAVSGGEAGEYTRAKGFLAYYEICEQINHNGWKVVKDPYQRMGPYAYKGDQWVSFDDVDILKKKVNFIKSLNLAGGMVWALDLDDFRNRCGQGKHPLMKVIKNGLLDPRIEPDTVQLPPMVEPPNKIDDDLEDIQIRPNYTKPNRPTPAPIKPTVQMDSIVATTKKPTTAVIVKEERYKIVCYYTPWSWYRPSSGKFTPSDIDPSLCTHIVYAYAALDADDLVIKPHDIWLDVENKFYERVVSLKSRGIRVLLGVGGWDDSVTDKYSRLVNNESARRRFVVHAIDYLEQYEFDGLNLDWEYPKCWQGACDKGPSSDKEGFAKLVKELRSAFNSRGLLLSAAVSANKRVVDVAYDIPTLSKNLDWIALMTYDYHGHWEKKTGHIAPMYTNERDKDSTLNTNFTVHYWIEQGADRQKLIMGVPFYGQSFSLDLTENSNTGLGAISYAGGNAGDETRARGFLSFYEICDRIKVEGWRVVRDPGGRMGPYATLEDQWVSFDDDYMTRHKAEYIRAMGLGGSMAWALDLDDFTGQHCGCGKSPLLANINYVLRGKEQPPPCPLEPTQDVTTPAIKPMKPQQDEESKDSSLSESECSGGFKAHESDCSKYYFCINGMYMELKCSPPSLWNKDHCDVPENTQCSNRKTHLNLRLNQETEKKPILACYFTNWAYYRKDEGRFGPEEVDPTMCTHIVYAWVHLNSTTKAIEPGVPELDINNDFYGKIAEYKLKGVKVIIGIGGLEDSEGDKWNDMAHNSKSRKTFVNSVLKFLRRWNFDGLQLAWQYPGCNQVPCNDFDITAKESFSHLLTDLSKALRPHNYELSAIVSSTPEIAFLSYEPEVLAATLDWIAIAANDYYASASGQTTYLVPLETSEIAGINSFNASLAYWASIVPEKMLVMGVPAYARSYTLRSMAKAGVGAPIIGPGLPGPYTAVPGFLAYYEICQGIKSRAWHEVRTQDGTYAVHELQWASYLRPEEVHRVAASTRRAGLRGAALWALDLDDWTGRCGCGPQPLLSAMRQGLHEPTNPPLVCLQ